MATKSNGNGNGVPTTVRCAIYTRKSTEEGLNQDFNSLDAQRDSGEAYVRSQTGEGWTLLTEAVLSVYGEGLRPHTWVIVQDVTSGQWGIGGQCITAEAVKELMKAPVTG